MRILAKILVGFFSVALVCGPLAIFQEHRALSTIEAVRASLVVGDSKEKVGRVMREHGLQPEISKDGRSYIARAWVPFRQDISITVVLNGHWEVGMIFIGDSQRF